MTISTTTLLGTSTIDEHAVVNSIDVSSLGLTELGKEYNTNLGRIDILAIDKNDNRVPIEVKLDEAGDSAVGQVLGYMKAVNAHRGIIVAKSFSKRVRAISADLNISLIEYIPASDNKQVLARLLDNHPETAQYTYPTVDTEWSIDPIIKRYNAEFPNSSSEYVKCLEIDDLISICQCIAINTPSYEYEYMGYINQSRADWSDVLEALIELGTKYREAKQLSGDPDPLDQRRMLLKDRWVSVRSKEHVTSTPLYPIKQQVTEFSTRKPLKSYIAKSAKQCEVKVPELNLYNALTGFMIRYSTPELCGFPTGWSDAFDDISRIHNNAIALLEWQNKLLKEGVK